MTTTTATTSPAPLDAASIEKLIPPTLFRLTDGLPIQELHQMVAEAKDCEAALLADICLLEKALQKNESLLSEPETAVVSRMLTTEMTPPDRFFTISSPMGRLRDPLAPPLPPTAARRAGGKRKHDKQVAERYSALLSLDSNPEYHRRHTDPTQLLAAWKRLSSHRTAAVFRRPVNPKEAPGYTDRILFPIDLQLIRKMIGAPLQISSYCDLHLKLLLICHNCVKFNGRESDYGSVTRDFEAHVEEVLLQIIMTTVPTPTTTATAAPTIAPVVAAAAAARPLVVVEAAPPKVAVVVVPPVAAAAVVTAPAVTAVAAAVGKKDPS